MRAAYYDEIGPAAAVIRIGEVETPTPGPGELLVRLGASGVNPHDVKRRSGWLGVDTDCPRVIPHNDGAGLIEAVGDGVPRERIGERVWTFGGRRGSCFGTAAEYIALAADLAQPLPQSASFAEGACIGAPAATAHMAVLRDGPVAGRTVLVAGGAGAVGHYAIQFAKLASATVLTTVSSPAKAAHARAAGADQVIDYKTEDVIARVRALTDGAGVDRVVEVDFGANVAIDAAIIKPGGVIASYSSTAVREPVLPYYSFAFKGVTLHMLQAYIMPPAALHAMIADIAERVADGALTHTVARRFPLAETAAAHEALESGQVIGKVVVEIDGR